MRARTRLIHLSSVLGSFALFAACGGNVVVDPAGGGGSGGAPGTTTTSTNSTTVNSSTGTMTSTTSTTTPDATTTTTNTTTTGPSMCDNQGNCGDSQSGCIGCSLSGNCADELNTCQSSQECIDFVTCLDMCSDQQCYDQCVMSFPNGATLYNDLVFCVICVDCYNDCDGPGSGC